MAVAPSIGETRPPDATDMAPAGLRVTVAAAMFDETADSMLTKASADPATESCSVPSNGDRRRIGDHTGRQT
jgi:hypothetical protein